MATVRDIAIIVVAVLTIVAFFLFVYLMFATFSFFRALRRDLKPILKSGAETLRSLRELLALVQETALSPFIRASRIGKRSAMLMQGWRFLRKLLRRKK